MGGCWPGKSGVPCVATVCCGPRPTPTGVGVVGAHMPLLNVGVGTGVVSALATAVSALAASDASGATAETTSDQNEPMPDSMLDRKGMCEVGSSMSLMVKIGTFASESDSTLAIGNDDEVALVNGEAPDEVSSSGEKTMPSFSLGMGIVARTTNKMSARMITAVRECRSSSVRLKSR